MVYQPDTKGKCIINVDETAERVFVRADLGDIPLVVYKSLLGLPEKYGDANGTRQVKDSELSFYSDNEADSPGRELLLLAWNLDRYVGRGLIYRVGVNGFTLSFHCREAEVAQEVCRHVGDYLKHRAGIDVQLEYKGPITRGPIEPPPARALGVDTGRQPSAL